MSYKTEQEEFWAGKFGDDYIERSNSEIIVARRTAFWRNVLKSANGVKSIKEFGCNIGLNLLSLKRLNPSVELRGVEINEKAVAQARALDVADIQQGSILDPMEDSNSVDLSFTRGVLIHINPQSLGAVYQNLVQVSRRYIMVAEYYNPTPVSVNYRGNEERLFKRDFAGELMDSYDLRLVDYGFIYRRDNWAAEDDLSWFLLEK